MVSNTGMLNQIEVSALLFKINIQGVEFEVYDHPLSGTQVLVMEEARHWPDWSGMKIQSVLDIGANCGFFSFFMAKKFPGSHIVAFEPIPYSADNIRRGIEKNQFQDVWLYQTAVTKDGRPIDLQLDPSNSGSASLYNPKVPSAFASFRVSSETLNEAVDGIHWDIVKVDVEGAEFELFEGFQDWDLVGSLYLELHSFMVADTWDERRQRVEELGRLVSLNMGNKRIWVQPANEKVREAAAKGFGKHAVILPCGYDGD